MRYYYKGYMFTSFRQLRKFYYKKTGHFPSYFTKVKAGDGGTIAAYR